jgi:hypothetical protein
MAELWSEEEWDVLFRAYRPRGRRPGKDALVAMAPRLGRTPDAVVWIWNDAESHLRGAASSAASQRLIDYLNGRRYCRVERAIGIR